MTTRDPRDPPNSGDHTIVRPRPGGGRRSAGPASPDATQARPAFTETAGPRAAAAAPPPPPPRARAQAAAPAVLREFESGLNPLIDAASPLLLLAAQLRQAVTPPDAYALREQAVRQMKSFESRANAAGVPSQLVLAARYCLCTFVDESVLNTPWGDQSGWAQQTLLTTFHSETWGGEKFFQILDRVKGDVSRHIDLLELIYVCLALGFAGRYHVEDGGRAKLGDVQEDLYQRIRSHRGVPPAELSLRWRGVEDRRNPVVRYVPLWVVGAASAVIVIGAFFWFLALLNGASAPISAELAQKGLDTYIAPAPPAAPLPPDAPPPPPRLTLKQLLAPEEAAGLLEVTETGPKSVVTLNASELFASASTKVSPGFVEPLAKVAAALNRIPGRVIVVGHTDDVRLKSLKFRDNFELSRERAVEVGKMLQQSLQDPARVEWTGVGPSQPRYTPANLPENRARNRRVEILHFAEG